MILPFLIIVLLLSSLYLSYQKNLDFTNKLIIIGLSILILNITLNYVRKCVVINNIEGFQSEEDINLESQAEVINITSPSYEEDIQEEDNLNSFTNFEDDFSNITSTPTPTTNITLPQSNINGSKLNNNNRESYKVEDETDNVSSENQDNFSNTRNRNRSHTITQSDMEGTASVFNPQIIISSDEVGIRSSPTEKVQTVYRQSNDWQTPANDLYQDENATLVTAPNERARLRQSPAFGPNYGKDDPWDTMHNNMERSYQQQLEDRNTCGGITYPFRDRATNYQMSSPSDVTLNRQNYGYSYVSPDKWETPQYNSSCTTNNCERPKGVYDRSIPNNAIQLCKTEDCVIPDGIFTNGTDLNVLELDQDGEIIASERQGQFTNVGSILPKFRYEELR